MLLLRFPGSETRHSETQDQQPGRAYSSRFSWRYKDLFFICIRIISSFCNMFILVSYRLQINMITINGILTTILGKWQTILINENLNIVQNDEIFAILILALEIHSFESFSTFINLWETPFFKPWSFLEMTIFILSIELHNSISYQLMTLYSNFSISCLCYKSIWWGWYWNLLVKHQVEIEKSFWKPWN